MKHQIYSTDLTDSQWEDIKDLIPPAKPGGRPWSVDIRLVVNALLYVVVGGIQWRMLPNDYSPWQSVYHYFRQWRDNSLVFLRPWLALLAAAILVVLGDCLGIALGSHRGRYLHP